MSLAVGGIHVTTAVGWFGSVFVKMSRGVVRITRLPEGEVGLTAPGAAGVLETVLSVEDQVIRLF